MRFDKIENCVCILSLFAIVLISGQFSCKVSGVQNYLPSTNDKDHVIHLVFFDLKENLNDSQKSEFGHSLELLNKIQAVKSIEIGTYLELNDPKAMSQYDYFIKLSFESKNDYLKYQSDTLHSNLKNRLNPYLEGPPVSYDYKLLNYSK